MTDCPALFPPRTLTTLRSKLLAWFDVHRRDLPWRSTRDPYRIWVSEVMLQQTTVAAVMPYFERFLAAFPTVQHLAEADESAVLKLWEGLGYYRRARHLHATARRVVADHAGIFPDDAAAWDAFPGVGRYIRGAVLSQAFERKLPIVEANSLRVLARLFGYPGDPRTGAGHAWVWSAAEAVLPAKRIGDFNQAMMELGAVVCTPVAPKCPACPWKAVCTANHDGTQAVIPPKKVPPVVVRVREVAVVMSRRGRYLVGQRPATASRWAGMWEFPHAEWLAKEPLDAAVVRVARELTGLTVEPGAEVLTVEHAVTRYAITLTAVEAARVTGRYRSEFYTAAEWKTATELRLLPTSTPQRLVMEEVTKPGRQRRLF